MRGEHPGQTDHGRPVGGIAPHDCLEPVGKAEHGEKPVTRRDRENRYCKREQRSLGMCAVPGTEGEQQEMTDEHEREQAGDAECHQDTEASRKDRVAHPPVARSLRQKSLFDRVRCRPEQKC